MMGTLLNFFLLLIVVLASVLCVFGPVAVLGVMFWKWNKDLAESVRLRQASSTQVRRNFRVGRSASGPVAYGAVASL